MSVVIFDLPLNERMNGLACWMTRTNDANYHPTFLQHLFNISSNMLDKILDRFNYDALSKQLGQNIIDKFSSLNYAKIVVSVKCFRGTYVFYNFLA